MVVDDVDDDWVRIKEGNSQRNGGQQDDFVDHDDGWGFHDYYLLLRALARLPCLVWLALCELLQVPSWGFVAEIVGKLMLGLW